MSPLSRILCIAVATLLLAALGTGCQSTSAKKTSVAPPKDQPLPPPPPPSWETPNKSLFAPTAQANGKLAPKMEVTWVIFTDQQKYMTGPAQVGPDGTVVIGPYGQYQVGGMTTTQASTTIEKGVRQYLPNSHFQLQVAMTTPPPAPTAAGTSWSSAGAPSNNVTAAKFSAPDWSPADKAPPACPHCAAATSPPAPAVAPPTAQPNPLLAESATPAPQNKRGPVMTYIFGPRF